MLPVQTISLKSCLENMSALLFYLSNVLEIQRCPLQRNCWPLVCRKMCKGKSLYWTVRPALLSFLFWPCPPLYPSAPLGLGACYLSPGSSVQASPLGPEPPPPAPRGPGFLGARPWGLSVWRLVRLWLWWLLGGDAQWLVFV